MIKSIRNKVLDSFGKKNWIDQNSIVFGFDNQSHCCETWGWGVYDPKTREEIAEDPDGLPYRFNFSAGTREISSTDCDTPLYQVGIFGKFDNFDNLDCVQVTLVHDEDPSKKLIFQAYTDHNGYYYHDFAFHKFHRPPRIFLLRGLPGSGKSTLAKDYDCAHLEGDMFAVSGGRYHWNDTDGSGERALRTLDDALTFFLSKKCDLVLSAVLPYCNPEPMDRRGHTLYHVLNLAYENGYEIWCETLAGDYGNKHGCPDSVYADTFLGYEKLKEQIGFFFGEEFANEINWCRMPNEVEVDNAAEK